MRTIVIAIAAQVVLAWSTELAAANLVRDDFVSDNWGGFVGWDATHRTHVRCRVERLDELSPNGKPAVRITSEEVFDNRGRDGMEVRIQRPLHLVNGETYRLSCLVRAKNLRENAGNVVLHGAPWNDSAARIPLPRDTDGKWVRLDWEGKLSLKDCDAKAVLAIYTGEALGEGAYVDFAEPFLSGSVAADESADALWKLQPGPRRLTPFEPLLNELSAKDARMTFYYPGDLRENGESLVLRATADGKSATASFGDDHKVTAAFGPLDPGPLTLKAELVGAQSGRVYAANEYRACVCEEIVDPTPLKRLNNFVREVFAVPLANGSRSFVLAKGTWVYFGFSMPIEGATVSVDAEKDVVVFRPDERSEGMRYLSPGRHVVTVTGVPTGVEGVFSVRTVKPILREGVHLARRQSKNFDVYLYGEEFWRRLGLFAGFNTTAIGSGFRLDPMVQPVLAEMRKRGVSVEMGYGMGGQDRRRLDWDAYLNLVTNNAAYQAGEIMDFDENSVAPHLGKTVKMHATEIWWKAHEAGRHLNVFLDDGGYNLYVNPTYDTPELSAYVNAGGGKGMIYTEAYFRSVESQADLDALVAFLRCQMRGIRETFPAAAGRYAYLLPGWAMSGAWSPWWNTEMDMRAMLAKVCRVLATDPAFGDNGGLAFSTPACWEDFFRFVSSGLIRYYCIDGGTGDFGEMNGMKLFPGHLTNGDFAQGFDGWTVEAAESGSVTIGEKKGFGFKWQGRQYSSSCRARHPVVPGDRFALLTRSEKAPNRLRQKLVGLEPGRVYQVVYTAADRETVERNFGLGNTSNARNGNRKAVNPIVLEATVTGVETIPDLCHTYTYFGKYGRGMNRTSRVVFRATGSEAELVFSDWKTGTDPGLKGGTKTLFNFVMVHPYYYESERQLETLKDLFRQAHTTGVEL